MSVNYFANAVYGVVLRGEPLRKLVAAVKKAMTDTGNEMIDGEEVLDYLVETMPDMLSTIKTEAGLPDDASFYLVEEENLLDGGAKGLEDGDWLAGYGVLEFPRDVPEEFKKVATWILWVEA